MYTLTASDFLKQIKADLIGKDSHRGITLTYAWLANQFGHFGIGYILTVIIFVLTKTAWGPVRLLKCQLIVVGLVVVFETYNFLGPLLKKHRDKAADLPFSPAWGNIAFDTVTDCVFFFFGAFSCSFLVGGFHLNDKLGLLCIALLIYPSYYWFKTRIYQQNAGLSIQLRLSQWQGKLKPKSKTAVEDFLKEPTKTTHFILNNKEYDGSALGICLANELAIKKLACYYTTLEKSTKKIDNNSRLWSIEQAHTVVVDDISSLGKARDFIVSNPKIKEQNIIWILSNELEPSSFITILHDEFIRKENELYIISV